MGKRRLIGKIVILMLGLAAVVILAAFSHIGSPLSLHCGIFCIYAAGAGGYARKRGAASQVPCKVLRTDFPKKRLPV